MLDIVWYNESVETFGNGAFCISHAKAVVDCGYPYTVHVGKAPPVRWTSRPAERLDNDGKPNRGRFAISTGGMMSRNWRDGVIDKYRGWQPGPQIVNPLFARIAERDGGWFCHYCHTPLASSDEELQQGHLQQPFRDHKHPKSKGGKNALDNLVLACRACNSSKEIGRAHV